MDTKKIKVAILTIGDEILYGQTLDTNSQWMGAKLDSFGFSLVYRATVGDNETDILNGLKETSNQADIILITGGLGPTSDDLTKPCLAKYFNVPLKSNMAALEELKTLFRQINRELTQSNIAQTNLPANADYISNSLGTAPGIWIEHEEKVYVSMPGVPFEMKGMMKNHVIPKLRQKYDLPIVVHQVIRTIGIGESWLAEKIAPWQKNLPAHIGLAYLPSLGHVKLRLTSAGKDKDKIEADLKVQIDALMPYAGKYIYSLSNQEIEEVVGELLLKDKLSLATAESCTGGYLAHLITKVPGSSAYYKGSIIAYDNNIKQNVLGVAAATLEKHGAVSENTVIEMARGAQKVFNTDLAVATSGIAGPSGGTDEKPVGTIWIAVAYGDKIETKQLNLFKDRVLNIKSTAVACMAMMWRILSR